MLVADQTHPVTAVGVEVAALFTHPLPARPTHRPAVDDEPQLHTTPPARPRRSRHHRRRGRPTFVLVHSHRPATTQPRQLRLEATVVVVAVVDEVGERERERAAVDYMARLDYS